MNKRHRALLLKGFLLFFVIAGEIDVRSAARANVMNMGPGLTSLEFVQVGNINNPANSQNAGAVSYPYSMGKFEVTAAQYAEFLNAVAASDPNQLYNQSMGDVATYWGCNIQRSGAPGSYSYSVASDWANRPVNHVSFGDVLRFVNWLHNGQPNIPAQDASTTEDGAYTLNGLLLDYPNDSIVRNAGARYWLPNGSEWVKAAYYNPATGTYFTYPTRSNSQPDYHLQTPDPGNRANFSPNTSYTIGAPYYRTPVGAFTNSYSPYGTFDQGGNVTEWTEEISDYGAGVFPYGFRFHRGGGFDGRAYTLQSSPLIDDPPGGRAALGFRIAALPVPEPTSWSLVMLVLFFAGRHRRR